MPHLSRIIRVPSLGVLCAILLALLFAYQPSASAQTTPSTETKPAVAKKKPMVRKAAIRKAFLMSVNKGQEAEYEKRHKPIWPELEATLRKHGVVTYTIFLNPETDQLFAYVEFKNQKQWDAVAQTAICKKWWAHMKEIMPSNPDNSPVSLELKEVFHIEK